MEPQHGQGSNSTAASSQSRRSSAENSSIVVDLGSTPLPQTEARECKHFGIRQYVAEMRAKDRKMCLPFGSDGDIDQFLPPMVVPEHKYWRCKNCLHGNGEVSRLEDIAIVSECSSCAPMSITTSSPSPSNDEMEFFSAILLSLATDQNAQCTEVVQQTTEIGQDNVETGQSQEGSAILVGVEKQSSPNNENGKRKIRDEKYDNSRKSRRPKIKLLSSLKDVARENENSENIRCGTEISPNSNSTAGVRGNSEVEIVISDPETDSEGTEDGVAANTISRKGKERSLVNKGKTAETGNRQMTIVPWREVINKSYLAETRGGKGQSQSSAAGTSSSKSKHNSSTGKGTEPSMRGSMPSRQQKERKSLEEIDKFVSNQIARNDAKYCAQRNNSPLPSNKNTHLVQNLGFSQARRDDNATNAIPKAKGKEMMPRLQSTPTEHLFFPTNRRIELNQKGREPLDSSYSPSNVHFGKTDVVEKQFFPKSGLKSVPSERSSILNSTTNPVKIFGRVLDQEKSKGPYVPAHMEKSSPAFPQQRQIVGPRFMQGIFGFMKDQPRTEVCTMNLNPADFSSPDAGNVFMINGADLKVVKRAHSRGKSH